MASFDKREHLGIVRHWCMPEPKEPSNDLGSIPNHAACHLPQNKRMQEHLVRIKGGRKFLVLRAKMVDPN